MLINNLPYRFIGDCICKSQQTFLSKYKSLIILALDFVFMLVLIKNTAVFCSRESRVSLADFLLVFYG